jgi:hypothetical protein
MVMTWADAVVYESSLTCYVLDCSCEAHVPDSVLGDGSPAALGGQVNSGI